MRTFLPWPAYWMTEPAIEDRDHRGLILVLHAIVQTAGECWDWLPCTATKADGLTKK